MKGDVQGGPRAAPLRTAPPGRGRKREGTLIKKHHGAWWDYTFLPRALGSHGGSKPRCCGVQICTLRKSGDGRPETAAGSSHTGLHTTCHHPPLLPFASSYTSQVSEQSQTWPQGPWPLGQRVTLKAWLHSQGVQFVLLWKLGCLPQAKSTLQFKRTGAGAGGGDCPEGQPGDLGQGDSLLQVPGCL